MRIKRGQVTIFIILAVLIVSAIFLFFLLRGKQAIDFFSREENPQSFIEKCGKDSMEEAANIMLLQGGYITPESYKLYKNNKVAYLCYTNKYYYSCINQEPLYIEFLEEEIKNYIEPKIKDCFYSLEQEYKDKGYKVNSGALDLSVELNPKQVRVEINKKLELSKNEETRKFENFNARLNTPLYDLAVIAVEIANQEAKFCNFEYVGFSLLYPEFIIEKKQVGSEETASDIYIIKEKISEKKMLIATRSCALPGGL